MFKKLIIMGLSASAVTLFSCGSKTDSPTPNTPVVTPPAAIVDTFFIEGSTRGSSAGIATIGVPLLTIASGPNAGEKTFALMSLIIKSEKYGGNTGFDSGVPEPILDIQAYNIDKVIDVDSTNSRGNRFINPISVMKFVMTNEKKDVSGKPLPLIINQKQYAAAVLYTHEAINTGTKIRTSLKNAYQNFIDVRKGVLQLKTSQGEPFDPKPTLILRGN